MAAILICSSDPSALSRLDLLAEEQDIRARTVSDAATAKKWLTLQTYNLLLVDSRFAEEIPMDLIREGWKKNPLMIGALFNLDGPVADEWSARISGARVYSGSKGIEGIRQTLQTISEVLVENDPLGILLIEDLDSPRDIVCSYIEALGYPRVQGAKSADDGFEKLRNRKHDFFCVISDINMPMVNGIEFVRQLRKDDALSHLPVIMLTAYATSEHLIACLKEGSTGFLVKPPRKRLLRAELDKAKRIYINKLSPRLCSPEDSEQLEDALARYLGP